MQRVRARRVRRKRRKSGCAFQKTTLHEQRADATAVERTFRRSSNCRVTARNRFPRGVLRAQISRDRQNHEARVGVNVTLAVKVSTD